MPTTLRRTFLLAFLGASTLVPRTAGAQERGMEVAEPRRTLSTLADSAHLRLLAPGVYVEDGRFLGFEHDSVHVADADAVLHVGADEIESLSVRGSKWLGVGLQSAGVGIVAGALAGYFYGTKECGDQLAGCDAHAMRVSLRWSLALGGLGALLGSTVGSRLTRWRAVFP